MPNIQGPLLKVQDLNVDFHIKRGLFSIGRKTLRAVNNVALEVASQETLGLVGESGSGKSTLGRAVTRLVDHTSGQIMFCGEDIAHARGSELRALRPQLGMVFQDPYSSLNPSMTVGALVEEPLKVHQKSVSVKRQRLVFEALGRVGLSQSHAKRYPHEFSGGQRQRIAIARALVLEPSFVVLDEAVSALDVSIQSQVLNLLIDLQQQLGLAFLFISHDLEVVRHISHRTAVMYLGEILEVGPADRLRNHPGHPYTAALTAAVPFPHPRVRRDPKNIVLRGEVPSPMEPPSGCRFRTRCPYAFDLCELETPKMRPIDGGGTAACHLHDHGPQLAGRSVLELESAVEKGLMPD